DTLGHKEGDRIITIWAKAIQTSFRKSDYAIRLGGDEFCIILIDHPGELTPRLLERIRYNLQIIAQDISISFSAGIYNMQPNDTIDDAYKA
ncbi:diguanylate cyclase, partial [Escherichia coli]|nr:diguanylate cyclase [Escherichia coli]